MSNPTQKVILDRRSTRGFESTQLTQVELQNLIDAALASPTARNFQPWHFAFVTDSAKLKGFNEAARLTFLADAEGPAKARYEDPNYDLLTGAPLFVVISYDPKDEHAFTGVDCGIAVENLALSAWAQGLGSVILGMPKAVFDGPDGEEWNAKFGIPAGYKFSVGIVIGHNTVTKDAHPILGNKYSVV